MIIIYSESGVSTEYHKRMKKIPPVKNQNIKKKTTPNKQHRNILSRKRLHIIRMRE